MADFEIQTKQELGKISFNYQELMNYVEEQVAPYKNMIVTENSLKSGKEVAARFNNMAKDLNKRRIEAQKIWMGPFDEFKGRIDEAIGKLEAGRKEIKDQLDAFEEKRIEERQKELKKLYADNISDYAEYLPYDRIFKQQWLNKSTKDSDVIFDINEAVAGVSTDIEAIKALKSEIHDECLEAYKRSGNTLAAAIQKNTDYLTAKRMAEEKLRAEQERKAQEAEKATETTVSDPVLQEKSQNSDLEFPKDDFINPPVKVYTIRVFDAKALEDIRSFCEFNEIEYEVEKC